VTDHRASPREPLEVRVVYEAVEEFHGQFTANVSNDGLFVRTPTPLAIGAIFAIALRLPNEDEAHLVRAEVRWTSTGEDPHKPRGMGVRLLWSDDQERAAFAQKVARLRESVSGAAAE
jgi:uncharacterized protein (TIGR02266 family)